MRLARYTARACLGWGTPTTQGTTKLRTTAHHPHNDDDGIHISPLPTQKIRPCLSSAYDSTTLLLAALTVPLTKNLYQKSWTFAALTVPSTKNLYQKSWTFRPTTCRWYYAKTVERSVLPQQRVERIRHYFVSRPCNGKPFSVDFLSYNGKESLPKELNVSSYNDTFLRRTTHFVLQQQRVSAKTVEYYNWIKTSDIIRTTLLQRQQQQQSDRLSSPSTLVRSRRTQDLVTTHLSRSTVATKRFVDRTYESKFHCYAM